MTGVPFVDAAGGPFEAGRAHGAARGARLRAFLADDLTRLNRLLPAPTSMRELGPTLDAYAAAIAADAPDLAEETRGLAAGAAIAHEQAVLLQCRREILGYQRIPAAGDCTTYARSDPDTGHPVLAQTVDLNGDLDDQIAVLRVDRGGRRSLLLSFGGQLGYLGLNSDGLAVGLNLVLAGDWRPGLPPYLAIRHLLDTASTVDEALRVLSGLRLAGSRSLTLCDATGVANVEFAGHGLAVARGRESVHTNHFLDPELAARDELNVFARNSSVRRLDACRKALVALPPDAAVPDHFAVLCTDPIRVVDTGDIRRERTVAAVVLRPDRGELHVRPGDPAHGRTHTFRLDGPAGTTEGDVDG